MEEIQTSLLARSRKFREDHTYPAETYEQFKEVVSGDGGFVDGIWCGSPECEKRTNDETKATIRCLPLDAAPVSGPCVLCGEDAKHRAILARAY